ncbi:developmental pluripotency-associated protein 3 [Acomys russatus]|uniref:developmental pluripotency-associated protein 3 n=1 Tax=Acomys russatus TaxID=60746 RepID=UPI0021E234AF|nr:developmental pluripotency-associated protein 3 [Acomys russatus]
MAEEPSEMLDSFMDPETAQKYVEDSSSDDSEILQPETLVKVMKKLNLNSSAKPPERRSRRRRRSRRPQIENILSENRSQKILREVQSAFPKRRVRTLLSVQKDPIARMRRLFRIEKKLKSIEGNENEERREPFRCLCTFCLYRGWDPSENAKIGENSESN